MCKQSVLSTFVIVRQLAILEFKAKATKMLHHIPLPTIYPCKLAQNPRMGFTDLEKDKVLVTVFAIL